MIDVRDVLYSYKSLTVPEYFKDLYESLKNNFEPEEVDKDLIKFWADSDIKFLQTESESEILEYEKLYPIYLEKAENYFYFAGVVKDFIDKAKQEYDNEDYPYDSYADNFYKCNGRKMTLKDYIASFINTFDVGSFAYNYILPIAKDRAFKKLQEEISFEVDYNEVCGHDDFEKLLDSLFNEYSDMADEAFEKYGYTF